MPNIEELAGSIISAIGPSEAEASPVGKLVTSGAKVAKKAISEAPSRTSKLLEGVEFMGKKIKAVTKGRGDWRHIVLDDDSVYPVTKDIASDLVRHRGTASKMAEFGAKELEGPSQVEQALKSLSYHEARANLYLTRKIIRSNYKDYARQVKQVGLPEGAMRYSLVERGGKTFSMPSEYATLLQKEGHLKIIEELK